MSSYSASKYGVEGFTDCLRHEMNLFGGVKVILIEPGFFNTPLVDSTKLQAVWDRVCILVKKMKFKIFFYI